MATMSETREEAVLIAVPTAAPITDSSEPPSIPSERPRAMTVPSSVSIKQANTAMSTTAAGPLPRATLAVPGEAPVVVNGDVPPDAAMAKVKRTRAESLANSIASVDTIDSATTVGPEDIESCVTEKRVKEWQKYFDVEEDEQLICTHGCALVSGIMLHGRMYVSNRAIRFRSNILGAKTYREIPLTVVKAITPSMVAGCIPNALLLTHGENVITEFTTLPDRDHSISRIGFAWRTAAPETYNAFIGKTQQDDGDTAERTLKCLGEEGANGVDGEDGDETLKAGAAASEGGKADGDVYEATEADTEDLDKQAIVATLRAQPEEVYKLMYHNEDFLRSIWEKQGFRDIQMNPWAEKKREFSYVKPIGGKLGSCKCVSKETIEHEDPETFYAVLGSTQTPDVPSGKSFSTKSKTVFSHSGNGGTKMKATYQVEWTGSSMLKGMINGQAESGQKQWNKLLVDELRQYIQAHPDDFHASGSGGGGAAGEGAGGTGEEDDQGRAPDPGTAARKKQGSANDSADGGAMASVTSMASSWMQEDAVRSLLVVALGLSLCLHFLNYLRGE